MSDSLAITTVAEGIEEAAQAERMLALGCTYGQGYYFFRPLAGDAVAGIVGGRAVRPAAATPRPVRFPRAAASVDVSPA